MVKSRYIGDGHPTFNRNPYNGYINPYYWVDDHPLLYGNIGSLDPSTYNVFTCYLITIHDSEWTTLCASNLFLKTFQQNLVYKILVKFPAWRMGSGDVLVQLEMAKVNFMAVAKVIR